MHSGNPFRLHFELKANNLGPVPANSRGTFSFTGVPANSAVTSCQGYGTGGVVAAHESSWGRVKILYR